VPYTSLPQASRGYQQSNNLAPAIYQKTDHLYRHHPPNLTASRGNINPTVRGNAGTFSNSRHPQQEPLTLVQSVDGSEVQKYCRSTFAPSTTPKLIKSNVFDKCEEWMFEPTLGGLIPQGDFPNSPLSKRSDSLDWLNPKNGRDLNGLPNTGDKRGREHLSSAIPDAKKQRNETNEWIGGEHEFIDLTDEDPKSVDRTNSEKEVIDHANSPNATIDLTDDNEPTTPDPEDQDEAPVEKEKQLFPKFVAPWEEGKPNPWQEKRLQVGNGQAGKVLEEGPLPYNGVEHALKMGVLNGYSWIAQMSAEQKEQEAKSKSAKAKAEIEAQEAAYKALEQSKLAPKLVPNFKQEEYAFDLIQDPLTSLPDGSGLYRCNHDCTGKECPYEHPCCKEGLKWRQKRETLSKAWKRKTLGEGYIIRTRRGNLIYPKEKGGMTVKNATQASDEGEKSPFHAQENPDIPDNSEPEPLHTQQVPVTPKTPPPQRPRILFPSPRQKPATLSKFSSVESSRASPEFEDSPEDNDGFEDALKEALEKELLGDDENHDRENLETVDEGLDKEILEPMDKDLEEELFGSIDKELDRELFGSSEED